jgi:glutamate decarboxylase
MPIHRHEPDSRQAPPLTPNPLVSEVSRLHLPETELDSREALRLIRDELLLDGNARLNLATFVTTWMEPEASELMALSTDKNIIDKDEYPQTAEIERRCVNMIADLWHAPSSGDAVGCSTTGSSEACMLAGLALLRRWRQRRKTAGAATDRPNLVMGTNVQVCWEKFCAYWDVEPRYVPMEPEHRHLTAEGAVPRCDENTIGVVAILGSTQDGAYEPVEQIAAALDTLASSGGPDVPVHVDAASGGFIAPFLDTDLTWDFRLARVASINSSGHKYGLVYPGVGWIIWRDQEALPEELVFHVNYLGGSMPTFALNFSRPGAQVIAQYYQLIRLGRSGYRAIQQHCRDVATGLAEEIPKAGPFTVLTGGQDLPVVTFTLNADVTNYSVFDISDGLRKRGWQVPAYTFPANMEDQAVLRIVVRNGFSPDLGQLFLGDLIREVKQLEQLSAPLPQHPDRDGFSH